MIPLRDIIPSRTTPFVTVGIILINVSAFLYELSLPEADLLRFLRLHGVVPVTFAWPAVLTSMFLHGGWLHVLGNMLYLWIFGDNVEDRMGHGRFIVFYVLCGTVATLVQVATDPGGAVLLVGASGAIAGVMGAYFVLYPHSRIIALVPILFFVQIIEVPAILYLGLWFLMQFLSGVGSVGVQTQDAGGIAFWAHVAGFVAGVAGVFVLRRPERQRVEWWGR